MLILILIIIISVNCYWPIDKLKPRYNIYYSNNFDISYIIDYSQILDKCITITENNHNRNFNYILECVPKDGIDRMTIRGMYDKITEFTCYLEPRQYDISFSKVINKNDRSESCFLEYDKNDYIRYNNVSNYIINFKKNKCIKYRNNEFKLYCNNGHIIMEYCIDGSISYHNDTLFDMKLISECNNEIQKNIIDNSSMILNSNFLYTILMFSIFVNITSIIILVVVIYCKFKSKKKKVIEKEIIYPNVINDSIEINVPEFLLDNY